MPQMAPYNWLLLNLYFTMIFLIYIIMFNYMLKNNILMKMSTLKIKFLIKW